MGNDTGPIVFTLILYSIGMYVLGNKTGYIFSTPKFILHEAEEFCQIELSTTSTKYAQCIADEMQKWAKEKEKEKK